MIPVYADSILHNTVCVIILPWPPQGQRLFLPFAFPWSSVPGPSVPCELPWLTLSSLCWRCVSVKGRNSDFISCMITKHHEYCNKLNSKCYLRLRWPPFLLVSSHLTSALCNRTTSFSSYSRFSFCIPAISFPLHLGKSLWSYRECTSCSNSGSVLLACHEANSAAYSQRGP